MVMGKPSSTLGKDFPRQLLWGHHSCQLTPYLCSRKSPKISLVLRGGIILGEVCHWTFMRSGQHHLGLTRATRTAETFSFSLSQNQLSIHTVAHPQIQPTQLKIPPK